MSTTEPILLDQLDYFGLIASDEFFGTIKVLRENKGVVAADIDQALSVLLEEGDKIGACVVVLMPELKPDDSEGPAARYFVRLAIQVIVQPLFADDVATGAGVTAEAVAERVRQVCHARDFGRGNEFMFDGMEPIAAEAGKVSYGVYFRRLGGDRTIAKVATPMIAAAGGTVSLSCGTAGAAIYYTLDGSYPSALNAEALLYSAPFALVEDAMIRAVATHAGMQPSEVAHASVEAGADFDAENPSEVELTTATLVQGQPGIEVLRISGLTPGSYLITGILHFALVGYVKPYTLAGINLEGGDPDGVQIQQTIWFSGYEEYPTPTDSPDAGPGVFGDAGYNVVECTSGTIALYLTSVSMTAGSIVVPPGGISASAAERL